MDPNTPDPPKTLSRRICSGLTTFTPVDRPPAYPHSWWHDDREAYPGFKAGRAPSLQTPTSIILILFTHPLSAAHLRPPRWARNPMPRSGCRRVTSDSGATPDRVGVSAHGLRWPLQGFTLRRHAGSPEDWVPPSKEEERMFDEEQ